MDRIALRIILGMLGLLGLSQACAGCGQAEPVAMAVDVEPLAVAYPTSTVITPTIAVAETPRASLDVPDQCNQIYVVLDDDGPRLKKRTPAWLRDPVKRAKHQEQVRREIAIIVDEMGGDDLAAEFLYRKAILESSGNAEAVHVLNQDLDANRRSASRGRHMSTDRWRSARVNVHDKRGKVIGSINAWTIGRGAYAMNSGLYMHRWSTDAPPWSLCDLSIATITAIWSLREGLARCNADDLRTAYRLLSAGQCGERSPEHEASFDRLARGRVRGLRLEPFDANAKADFGERWPSDSADPAVLLAVIRLRLAEESRT